MSWSPTNTEDAVWLFLFHTKALPEFLSQRGYKHSLNKGAPRPALYSSAHPCCWGPCQAGHALPPAQLSLLTGKQQDPQRSNLPFNKAHTLIIPDPNPPLTLFTNARLLGNTQPCFQRLCGPLATSGCTERQTEYSGFVLWHFWVTRCAPVKQWVEQRPLRAPQLFLMKNIFYAKTLT